MPTGTGCRTPKPSPNGLSEARKIRESWTMKKLLKKSLIYLELGLVACVFFVALLPITCVGAVVGAVNVSVAGSWMLMRAHYYRI